jgi:plastocyanin
MRCAFRAFAVPLTLILLGVASAGCTGPAPDEPAAPSERSVHSVSQVATGKDAPKEMGHDQQPAPSADKHETAPPAPNQVVIDNFTYSPLTLTVAAGTKVTWVNRDDVPHTVTSPNKPRVLASPSLDTDESFTFEFTRPGTYDYFCAVHPKMTGKIIVK